MRFRSVLFPALVFVVGGCGDNGAVDASRQDASGERAAPDVMAPMDAAVEEPDPHQYPRVYADPTLTTRIVDGPAELVGPSACSNELPMPGDRWCAFSKRRSDDQVELWVFNASNAIKTGAAGCAGTTASCLRLTENLWTGRPVWGPSHPYGHRFHGDTLIFHADAPAKVKEPYEGPIYAWRPGWPTARRISTAAGAVCAGHRRSSAVFCIDAADVIPVFAPPRLRAFDLLAGRLDDAVPAELARLERITFPPDDDSAFRARFTGKGDQLAYSSFPAGATAQALKLVDLAPTGAGAPRQVLADAAEWEIAHDGAIVYFLRGYEKARTGTGSLAMANLADGSNIVTIAADVASLELLGAHDDVFTDVDRGIGFSRIDAMGHPNLEIMLDRSKPEATQLVGVDFDVVQIATDRGHTFYFEDIGRTFPVAKVARNDGSGSCLLNFDVNDEKYAGHFSDSGNRVFWIEYGRTNSEEGWTAEPNSCQERVKFGDWVLGYQLAGEDLVLFEGGDEDDHTSYLQYTWLNPPGDERPVTPKIIEEEPTYPYQVIRSTNGTYVIYGRKRDVSPALYVHGPLERDR